MTEIEHSKSILVILGSPRKKGNSTTLAMQMADGANAEGVKTETVFLHGLKIAPCSACLGCKKPESLGCVVDDDMQPIYRKIETAGGLIVASPVYWFTMSAQMKLFMDRCYGLLSEGRNPLKDMPVAVAMSFGDSDAFNSGCVNALRSFQDSFAYVGARIVGMVYGSANEAGEIAANEGLMAAAEALGRRLACEQQDR